MKQKTLATILLSLCLVSCSSDSDEKKSSTATGSSGSSMSFSVLAGSGSFGDTDGTGTAAVFSDLKELTMDASGNLYASDWGIGKIKKITPAGVVTTIVSGLNQPRGLVVDTANNKLYVSNSGNHTVGVVDLSSGSPSYTVIAGTDGASGSTNGTGTGASFNSPTGLALIGTTLYVYERTGKRVRSINLSTFATATIAGTGVAGSADNSDGTLATIGASRGILACNNNLYLLDHANLSIRKITLSGLNPVTTVATGTNTSGYGVAKYRNGDCDFIVNGNGTGTIDAVSSSGTITTSVNLVANVSSSATVPMGMVLNGTTLYWIENGDASTTGSKIHKITNYSF